MSQKALDNLDFVKLKSCVSKVTIKMGKRQPAEREKIFANNIFDKGLISRIYKQLLQLNNKKTNKII
jgi:hypothetical protein